MAYRVPAISMTLRDIEWPSTFRILSTTVAHKAWGTSLFICGSSRLEHTSW